MQGPRDQCPIHPFNDASFQRTLAEKRTRRVKTLLVDNLHRGADCRPREKSPASHFLGCFAEGPEFAPEGGLAHESHLALSYGSGEVV